MSKIICKICGREEDTSIYPFEAKKLEDNNMCLDCIHWHEQNELDKNVRGPYEYAIINNGHYTLNKDSLDGVKGFGGKKFHIRFNDGHEEFCDNLTCQGRIPNDYWRELMPDNAEFVY